MSKGLRGQFNHNIDAKGRLIVPAKFRELLGEEFVVTKGLDHCLFGYPNEEWDLFEEKLRKLPIQNKKARQTKHFFISCATDCEIDSQGRILIPSVLREFAGLEKEVAIVGNGERIEIWDREVWDSMSNDIADNMDDIVEELDDLGIEF